MFLDWKLIQVLELHLHWFSQDENRNFILFLGRLLFFKCKKCINELHINEKFDYQYLKCLNECAKLLQN